MGKKIYDVLPPKVGHKVKNDKKNQADLDINKKIKVKHHLPIESKKVEHKKEEHKELKKRVRKFPTKEIVIGSLIIVFLCGIYLYKKLPKAEIQIWPTLEEVSFQEKILADKSVSIINLFQKVIPAESIEILEEGDQDFEATGTSSNNSKASGIIVIYNKINPSKPLTLIKGTHFLSDSGKYFVTLERVTIPGAKGKTPGSIEVSVQAKEFGEDYNIGPANFSVPKLSGTVYYHTIWAESKNEMSGGYTGILKKVTKDDLSRAKDVLTQRLLNQADDSLKKKISSDYIILEEAILREVVSANSDAKLDSVVQKFNQSAKTKISALVFKRSDLESFVKDYISSKLSEPKLYWDKSLEITYVPELVDIQKGTETLNLQISVKTYNQIDIDELVDLSSRKSEDDIKEVVFRRYENGVSGIKIDFWPFWVNSAPSNKNRIKVNLNFE